MIGDGGGVWRIEQIYYNVYRKYLMIIAGSLYRRISEYICHVCPCRGYTFAIFGVDVRACAFVCVDSSICIFNSFAYNQIIWPIIRGWNLNCETCEKTHNDWRVRLGTFCVRILWIYLLYCFQVQFYMNMWYFFRFGWLLQVCMCVQSNEMSTPCRTSLSRICCLGVCVSVCL